MLRDIAGIRLCGANFDEVTNILLLDPHEGNKVKPVKGTLLYGRSIGSIFYISIQKRY